jgi:hypothetical protein
VAATVVTASRVLALASARASSLTTSVSSPVIPAESAAERAGADGSAPVAPVASMGAETDVLDTGTCSFQ